MNTSVLFRFLIVTTAFTEGMVLAFTIDIKDINDLYKLAESITESKDAQIEEELMMLPKLIEKMNNDNDGHTQEFHEKDTISDTATDNEKTKKDDNSVEEETESFNKDERTIRSDNKKDDTLTETSDDDPLAGICQTPECIKTLQDYWQWRQDHGYPAPAGKWGK